MPPFKKVTSWVYHDVINGCKKSNRTKITALYSLLERHRAVWQIGNNDSNKMYCPMFRIEVGKVRKAAGYVQEKQERQCAHNVTLRCVLVTTVAVEKQ